jgi:hypothetical protein
VIADLLAQPVVDVGRRAFERRTLGLDVERRLPAPSTRG